MIRPILLTLLAATSVTAAFDAHPADKSRQETHAAREPIPYDELKYHVGERIVVHTKFRSTRVGTLVKFSKIELTLEIPTPSGPAELTLPKDTVVRVLPADDASTRQPSGGKN